MDRDKIRKLLGDVREKKIGVDGALKILRFLPYEDLEFAKIDTHRTLRKGFPEVILGEGKSTEQITKIAQKFLSRDELLMVTKASKEVYEAVVKVNKNTVYYEVAKIVLTGQKRKKRGKKTILVVSAGTSDLPIAEEAAVTAEIMGNVV
ncbi:MAG: 1-(5-phosphoribosyl)-5-amino-4-imidazole-carboxylate carboxylase, partial [Thermoplasmatales archaeon]|nr:1-(5-phosphoribosyl)-5-amino-4-imidazole-carboxylate carboxylase [Thermoplasmatales archaeon]